MGEIMQNCGFSQSLSDIVKSFSDEAVAMQNVFLFTYLAENGRESEYAVIKAECEAAGVVTEDAWQEIIKCITHELPYNPLLLGNFDPICMGHVRRYMEETGCENLESPFLSIAGKMLAYFDDKNVLYEFRRFNKANNPITYEQDLWLFHWAVRNKPGWAAIAALYEVYCADGFERMVSFAEAWEEKAARGWTLMLQVEMFEEANSLHEKMLYDK